MNHPPNEQRQLQLLASAVDAARQTSFWRRKLGNGPINSLSDFERLPLVEAREYRQQRFADLVTNPEEIDLIPGPLLGQSPDHAPVAEGVSQARLRVRILREALSPVVPKDVDEPSAVIASTFDNRYFGAEMCAVFVRMGIPAHLVSDSGTDRFGELVSKFEPDIVALLSDRLDADDLPTSVRSVVTVGAGTVPKGIPFLDLYVCNEFGVLGSKSDGGEYNLAHDAFYFETSSEGALVVTPYFSRVQPIVRLDTGDTATFDLSNQSAHPLSPIASSSCMDESRSTKNN